MKTRNKIILLILVIVAAYSVGRYTAPIEVKEKIVKVEVEKKVEAKEEYKKETKKFNDKGVLTELTVETGKKEVKLDQKRQAFSQEKTVKKEGKWSYLRVGGSVDISNLNNGIKYDIGYGFQVFKSIGLEVNGSYNPQMNDKSVGVGLIIKF